MILHPTSQDMKTPKVFICAILLCAIGSYADPIRKLERRVFAPDPDNCTTVQECEEQAREYLSGEYEMESSRLCQIAVNADFEYNTDLANQEKEEAASEANIAYARFKFDAWKNVISKYNYSEFADAGVRRQLQFLNIVGTAALEDADLEDYNAILGTMSKIYGTAKICPYENQNCDLETEGLTLEPDIEEIIGTPGDSAKLSYTWTAWRDASGKPIREMYKEFIALSNKAAEANGLADTSELWLVGYESENFKEQVRVVWEEVKQLYDQLYGYVRFRLRSAYPDDFQDETDPIPAHLLGNVWSQSWENVYSLVVPYPEEPVFDVTDALKEKFTEDLEGVTALFQEADNFFIELGLSPMEMSYGEKAMIIKPDDGREVVCHASAWDFCDKADYRIKMCTKITQDDYATVHHELGHIQYFIQYKDQPIIFRDGANPGFHEAIGDVLSLSVATPKHMAKMGYLDSGDLTNETTINYLMQKALEKVAFLPFGYLIDAYRWGLFDGSTSLDQMEYSWLKLRNEIQGVIPPTIRSEDDFDAGAKYHVPGNTPYIRYFVSFILQFQIHKRLCEVSGEFVPGDPEKPLYNCDIAGNPEAGDIMRTLLEKGFSENWQDVLEEAIGSRDMDGSAIVEYFTPLMDFFAQQQAEHGYSTEWKMDAFESKYNATKTSGLNNDDMLKNNDDPNNPEEKDDKIETGMIVVGIIQGAGIVIGVGIYLVKTVILKK